MNNSRAVIISDVHYSLSTLPLADMAMREAIAKANELDVPLIVSGDLHDTKASLRGECVKAMLDTFKLCKHTPNVLIGNHDLINEKGKEHSLEFLKPFARVIDSPTEIDGIFYIPYQHDPKEFIKHISKTPEDAIVICHQGVTEAEMGDYVQDKSAVPTSVIGSRLVFSGHYHRSQTIHSKHGSGQKMGAFSYIGNPYSLSFGEAGDGPKGYAVLDRTGALRRIPILQTPKHWAISANVGNGDLHLLSGALPKPHDHVWVKISGPRSKLNIPKSKIAELLGLPHTNFKLDLIPTDSETQVARENKSDAEILDEIIETSEEPQKEELKALWREICA